MVKTFVQRFPLIIPLATALLAILAVHSTFFHQEPNLLALALCGDLMITSPLLYYLLVRKTAIPKITVLSVFILGLIIASYLLPAEQQWLPTAIKQYGLPILELGIVGWILYQVFHIRKTFKQQAKTDFYSALRLATESTFPPHLAKFLSGEIASVYYALFCWRKPVLQSSEFSYHKNSGVGLIIGTLVGVIMVETFAVHLLLAQWSELAAWIASFLSLYGIIQLIAMARSAAQLPVRIDQVKRSLQLRYGFFAETELVINSIEQIDRTSRVLPEQEGHTSLSPLGSFGSHNLVIHLKTHAHLERLYGAPKPFTSIAIWVDERDKFLQEVSLTSEISE
ncbi:MAG: hypothetical protein AAFZ63_03805 [Bacteroidota bacterium]